MNVRACSSAVLSTSRAAAVAVVVVSMGCSGPESEPSSTEEFVPITLGARRLPTESRILSADGHLPSVPYEVVRHSRPAVHRELERLAELLARDTQAHRYREPACAVTLAHVELVVITCTGRYDVTGAVGVVWSATHIHLDSEGPEPFALVDAFGPGVQVEDLLTPACVGALGSAADCASPSGFALGRAGLRGRFAEVFGRTVDVERSYPEIIESLAPAGPLARALHRGEEARDPRAWAVGPAELRADAVHRWTRLPTSLRERVSAQVLGPSLVRLVSTTGDREEASRLGSAAGVGVRSVRLARPDALDPIGWARATRAAPVTVNGRAAAILPRGALVAAMGRLDDRDLGASVWVRSAMGNGAVDARALEPHASCVPDAPPAFADQECVVALLEGRELALFITSGDEASSVAAYEIEPQTCALGERRWAFEEARGLLHLERVSARRDGGPTLLLSGTRGDAADTVRYTARVLGGGPVWQRVVSSEVGLGYIVRVGHDADGTYAPLAYWRGYSEPLRMLLWSEDRLVEGGLIW